MTTKTRSGLGRVYLDATAEAVRRGDRRVGTEHLILALLVDPDSRCARALGVSVASARAALGIDADVDHRGPVLRGPATGRLRLTPAARSVLTGLREEAGSRRLDVHHVLLRLLSTDRPDPAAELVDELDLDRARVRALLTAG